MITAKINKIEREKVIATGEEQLAVSVCLFNDGEMLEVRKIGFSIDTTSAQIKADIKSLLDNYKAEAELAVSSKAQEAVDEQANKTISELESLEIE